MNELYPELEPKKRISRIINEYLSEEIVKFGFTPMANGSLKRKRSNLVHEISFPGHKQNIRKEFCGFDVAVSIASPKLNAWYKSSYGVKLENNIIMSHTNDYIPRFKNEFSLGYNFALYDNSQIIRSLKSNLINSIIPYLEKFDSFESTVGQVMNEGYYFKAPILMDACEIIGSEECAHRVVSWFELEVAAGTEFSETTFNDIMIRKNRLSNGYNN